MQAAAPAVTRVPGYECTGPAHAPVIIALGGISAHSHVCATPSNTRPGWWDAVVGNRRALDTDRYRVVSIDYLDGGVASDGLPAAEVTTHDQADAIVAVLDELGVDRAQAIVGASYGGMVALALAERYPERVERLVIISAAHRSDALTRARRLIQRQIVELGIRAGAPRDALIVARALAMTTYRSRAEFESRFASDDARLASYLRHHGEKFAATVAPARFLALSLSADTHAVRPENIGTPATLVAAQHDDVVPRVQLEELAERVAGASALHDLATVHGHDAFLADAHLLGEILTTALNDLVQ